MLLTRSSENPILIPNPDNPWENYATFNGTVIRQDDKYVLLYRAMGREEKILGQSIRLSSIGKSISEDGLNFEARNLLIAPDHEWEKYGCEDPRVTYVDGKFFIFYTALSNYPFNYHSIKVGLAISPDLNTISSKHLITPFNAKAMAMFPEKINNKYTVILTVNTDNPPTHIAIAQFEKIEMLWSMDFWKDWYKNLEHYIVPLRRVNSDGIEVGATPVKTSSGWVLIYSYIKHYFSQEIKKEFRIEAVLLDLNDPQKIVGRIENPLLTPQETYEKQGIVEDVIFPEGALIDGEKFKVYYGAADTTCCLAYAPFDEFMRSFEVNQPGTLKSHKFPNNPILEPKEENPFESKAVFNPAVIDLDGKIYIVYRALSDQNISSFGLAVSNDGLLIDERLNYPIYTPRMDFEKTSAHGSTSGCEDPRITKIEDNLYMLYTAYDGELARLAMTSISVDNFLKRRWDLWEMPKIISPPGVMDKDGALFPEKINGKYVLFHRIEPNICIDYVDDLKFNNSYLISKNIITPHHKTWDAKKIGINTPPLKTDKGWIVFYHGISEIDGHYRVGALLLDLQDVTKVIGWTFYPILEPETIFEREGVVPNVVFPCGYVLKEKFIYLYYGGADKVVCGATIALDRLLEYLVKSSVKKYLSYP